MSTSSEEMAQAILDNIGGAQNVASIKRCATRIRFILKNGSLTKEENLKRINGLLGIIEADNLYYLVVEEKLQFKLFNSLKALLPGLPEELPVTIQKEGFVSKVRNFFSSSKKGNKK